MKSRRVAELVLLLLIVGVLAAPAVAQPAPGGPPAVGVVRAERQQVTQTDEFIGRIQAIGRVALVARVTAFLEKRLFVEGAEVHKGDLLYQLEQPPFQAQVDADKATVDQLEAQHRNAEQTAGARAGPVETVGRPTIKRSTARSPPNVRLAAQIDGAKAQLRNRRDQSRLYRDSRPDRRHDQRHRGHRRQCRLADQRDPGDPRQPGSDVRAVSGLDARRARSAQPLRAKGRFRARSIAKLRLPDGRIYEQDGKVEYVSPTIAKTPTRSQCAAVVPNPLITRPDGRADPRRASCSTANS